MGRGKPKSAEVGPGRAGQERKRNPTVAVVLKPESFQKLVRFAREDGPRPSTLASLLLEVALQAREAAGSYNALRQHGSHAAAERLRLRTGQQKPVTESIPVPRKSLDKARRD
jgi:hypothetical protein